MNIVTDIRHKLTLTIMRKFVRCVPATQAMTSGWDSKDAAFTAQGKPSQPGFPAFRLNGSRLYRFTKFALAAASLVSFTPAIAQSAQRSVVPIREVVIHPIDTPRYVVTVTINGMPFEVGLDTGSVGLRLLPKAVERAGVIPGSQPARYSYGSGVQLDGQVATADIQIGSAKGKVTLQAVERVSCVAQKKNCPATYVSPAEYGLMGSGQPGQGFQAIMGTRLNNGDIPNPLTALGIRSWIVHLPQRGGSGGELILNPDKSDLAGFVPLRNDTGIPGTVVGCAMIDRADALQLCGSMLLDTGAPGVAIHGAERPLGWQPSVPARLVLAGATGIKARSVVFRTGDKLNGGNTDFEPGRGNGISMNAGTLPFYAYDVLFNQEHNEISVRPNGSGSDAVHAAPL